MKNNTKTVTKKVNQVQQSSSGIRSLRSIINQTKMPLSDYINNQRSSVEKNAKKVDKVRTKTSYFEKFKGMIGNTVIERTDQQLFAHTPFNIIQKHESMEEQTTLQQNNTIDLRARQSFCKRKLTNCPDRSRSKSFNQHHRVNPNIKELNRNSFQPKRNIKTQQQNIINSHLQKLPPKPLKYSENLKTNIQNRKNIDSQKQIIPLSSRTIVQKQYTELTDAKKRQHSQMKPENSFDSMIQHIHSHRRLNFQKQEERKKEIIIYGKGFQKLAQNKHCNEIKLIETNLIQIGQVLGHGAFSYVKVGNPKGMIVGKKLAIKIYEKYKLIEPGRKSRVLKEIQLLSQLNHPNVIKLFSAYENKRQIHILFEQIEESITLQEYFKHMSLRFHDDNMLIVIMKEVLKGLEYLHSLGVSHRDIKPDNVLVSFIGDLPVVKLIDFGFATNSQTSNVYCGTPNFMAPELLIKHPYSPCKADMWAFAVMLYYLLQSKYPFKGFNQKDLTRNICENNPKFDKTPLQFQQLLSLLFQTHPDMRISAKQTLNLINQI